MSGDSASSASTSTTASSGDNHVKLESGVVEEHGYTAIKYRASFQGRPISFQQAMVDFEGGGPLTQLFLQSLRSCPYQAYFFESPPVSLSTYPSRPFEYVLIDSPDLAAVTNRPTPEAFADYIRSGQGTTEVASFYNLGRDALLVTPCQSMPDPTMFTHLAQFSRQAGVEQQLKLWKAVARGLHSRVDDDGSRNYWLSTSGMGVYWLHIRLDTKPKYYNWQPYKRAT